MNEHATIQPQALKHNITNSLFLDSVPEYQQNILGFVVLRSLRTGSEFSRRSQWDHTHTDKKRWWVGLWITSHYKKIRASSLTYIAILLSSGWENGGSFDAHKPMCAFQKAF